MPTNDTYSITYQYKPEEWHSHYDVDHSMANAVLHMCNKMGRDCRVRQNATGRVEKAVAGRREPLTLLHLFSKRISGRCGSLTD